MVKNVDFSTLTGEILSEITGATDGSTEIIFHANDGRRWRMHHYQDCCESVYVEDVCGDVTDLIGTPILLAEEASDIPEPVVCNYNDSYTWTFYRLRTIRGTVVIRWYGESNGYYSESVDFEEMTPKQHTV